MMKKSMLFSSVLAAALIFTGCSNEAKPAAESTAATATAPTTGENVINIEASNWKFNQDRFEVKAGQPVTVNLKSTEGYHGIVIDGLGVEITKEGRHTFTPDKPGEYQIMCSIPCGTDHGKMTATLVVK